MNNLRVVRDGLRSEKIKERQEALQAIRTTFADDQVVRNFTKGDGSDEIDARNWLSLFQALFTAVTNEKSAYAKAILKVQKDAKGKARETRETKSSTSVATATRRLEEATKVVRWLTERASETLNSSVLKSLYRHLTGMLVYQGRLLTPVALDYIKALKHLASFRPHLDHMDDSTWIRCAEICFNIILGDPIESSFSDDAEDAKSESGFAAPSDSGNPDSDEEDLPSTSNPKKRRRGGDRGSVPPSSSAKAQPKSRSSRLHRISVTSEQVECAALLSTLLHSPNSPICRSEYHYIPSAVLTRLQRFLEMYPSESSLLHDYLSSIAATLDHLALNTVREVRSFARATWRGLVALWGLKDKRLKEELVMILRMLFPFIMAEEPVFADTLSWKDNFNTVEGLGALWAVLEGEADNKWGINGLNLHSLRLEIMEPDDPSSKDVGDNPFVANTFRSGWSFDSGQALSWAILELQADCAKELFQLSESMHPSTPSTPRGQKRAKLQNPIVSLLNSIQTQAAPHLRSYHLQVLLFFVDRHWIVVHDSLKRDIISTLLQFVTLDDGDIQSWIFLNFAAIAFSEKHWIEKNVELLSSSQHPEVVDAVTWDQIWTHAVRRANVPHVCRAACHAAYSLLVSLYRFTPPSGHIFLTSQRVLLEIETLGKDMDVQGPSSPFDSVCMFLTKCLKIAAQDARLYRMQLEDKVLSWLMDAWAITGVDKATMSLHSIRDILQLLETISGLGKQSDLISQAPLPSCAIVDSMKMEQKVKTIRGFLLFAKLPSYAQPKGSSQLRGNGKELELDSTPPLGSGSDVQLPPRGRERRITAFIQRMLDALSLEWDSRMAEGGHPTIEVARQALDFVIIAITYESTLAINSTTPNRRVIQTAGKLLTSIFSFSKTARWTVAEQVTLIAGLDPLISTSIPPGDPGWDAVTSPDYANDGINRSDQEQSTGQLDSPQRRRGIILRTVWKSSEFQHALGEVSKLIRDSIEKASQSSRESATQVMGVDDRDGFGPIRTTASQSVTNTANEDSGLLERLYEIYILVLTRGPLLQSSSGQPTRDRNLVDCVIKSAEKNPSWFISTLPILSGEIGSGALEINAKQLCDVLEAVGEVLQLHAYSRNQNMQVLVVKLLYSTLGLWTLPAEKDVRDRISQLCAWLCTAFVKGRINAWKTRDIFTQFLEKFLSVDPIQSSWARQVIKVEPKEILEQFAQDDDIRVRFRTAVVLPRLFVASHHTGTEIFGLYDEMKRSFSSDVDDYEQMATRLLSLANIMIVSSAVRRGPYWHLLETCHHSSSYSHHIEAVLNAVVERLDMPSLSSLFEAYAFQLAYSMIHKGADFLAFPPRLLGYRDRSSCAEAAFRAFVPTYVILGAYTQYENHCKVLQKSPVDGLRECFGDIVGFYAATYFDTNPGGSNEALDTELRNLLHDDGTFQDDFERNVDGIATSILRTLGDQDYSSEGPIIAALKANENSAKAVQVFMLLSRHRHLQAFEAHKPNLPAFGAATIIRAILWLSNRTSDALSEATIYHVVHQLFADIQHTPLINEKFRLLNSLCLWIALKHEDFTNATLLQTLLHGATSLLNQPSLARAAQSLLEWTFRTYRKLKAADLRLSRILIRISSVCHDYSVQTRDQSLSKLGRDLLSWIDEQTFLLGKIPIITPVIHKALPAWPHEPSQQLAELYNTITLANLSAILQDEHIASNKFRVVRRLKDFILHDNVEFAKKDFWRLKESLPPNNRLQEEDMIAFTDLLISNHGQIDNLSGEQLVLNTVRNRHRRLNKKNATTGEDMIIAARDAIILGLLTLLEGESPSLVHIAYNTLRLMMSVLPNLISHLQSWSSEHRVEAEFLQKYPRHPVSRPSRNLAILLSSEYYVEMSAKFSQWITHISVLVSDILASRDAAFGQLYHILSTDAETAEEMLPVLIFVLLQADQLAATPDGSSKRILTEYFTRVLNFPKASLACLKSIVEVVLHLRNFQPRLLDALAYNRWLDIDFPLLAQNAVRCGAYTTALLFLELAHEGKSEASSEAAIAEQIQYEIYAHIDEPDGFYGIRTQNLHRFLIQRFHHEDQWENAFRFHGAMLEADNEHVDSEEAEGLLNSFHSFGFNHLAIRTLQTSDTWSASSNKSTSSSMGYRIGWRSETWDLPDSDTYTMGAPLYHALRAIHRERDSNAVDSYVKSALYKEMAQLRSLGAESVAEMREVLQALMCLNQILCWKSTPLQQNIQSKSIDFDRWQGFLTISPEFDFSDLENIMSVRISLIRSIRQREERQQIGVIVSPFLRDLLELEKRCLLKLSKAARDSGQIQIALNSVVRAQKLDKSPSFQVLQEYANVLWSLKEEKLAVTLLKDLVKQSQSQTTPNPPKAALFACLGTWTAEAYLEKPVETWEQYFAPAIQTLQNESPGHEADRAMVYQQCAVFADRQYHAILKSADAIRWKVYVERKKQEIQDRAVELQELKRRGDAARIDEVGKAQGVAEKLLKADVELYRKHNSARDEFLRQALDMYGRCLEVSDGFDNEASIKFSSLWFANFDDDDSVESIVGVALDRIPSRKFIFLAHQLTARITKAPLPQQSKNQEHLQRLILRLCQEHPFHSLYQVYCLKADKVGTSTSRRQSRVSLTQDPQSASQTERCAAAEDVLGRLREDPACGQRVRDVERLCEAYLEWAKFPIANLDQYKRRAHSFKIPPSNRILQISKVRVPVLTTKVKIDPTLRYEDCIWIDRFVNMFETAGGINLPKITTCVGSDGVKYKQLFKGEGKDDMRQDAVMEQVFELVNKVLLNDRQTCRRALQIRSYKVIPLGTQAGVLEFVGNTFPLRDWLYKGHQLYRPKDIKPQEAHARLTKHLKTSPEQRLKAYTDVRTKFKPVFRHFFTEKHRSPMAWFATRLRYTRSVAASSIVGHVLGLGDRHTSNILMDHATGEVIHIDLGIAFDQGKLLPVPELVPFRLTGDIVDGMGIAGTQGVFQRCAEETLRVLRDGSDIIMTVLEVFKYDPLHSWSASEIRIRHAQQDAPSAAPVAEMNRSNLGIGIDMTSGTAEEAADRALSSVARKLAKSLSVESTVNELIAEATDPMNLAVIFPGWGPQL